MNINERIKMVKAMEYIARQLNNEDVLMDWLSSGVADGDITYGNLEIMPEDEDNLGYYVEDDEDFADLMDLFLYCMTKARKSGGLYSDGVVSGE